MESIASKLKAKRESLNTSLEQISKNTHISIHHLRSLENGCYADLPGGMYRRAILRAYCDEIGLDKNEILRIYDVEVAPGQEKQAVPTVPLHSKIRIQAATVWCLILILGVCLFLNREWFITALSPYFSSDYGRHVGGVQPEYPPIYAKTVSADAPTNAAMTVRTTDGSAEAAFDASRNNISEVNGMSIERPSQTVAFSANNAGSKPLRLEITGKEECWLSVTSDESGAVTKLLSPGDVAFFSATRTIFVIVGNAGGVSLRINDRVTRTLGRSGEVVRLTIDMDTLPNLIDSSAS